MPRTVLTWTDDDGEIQGAVVTHSKNIGHNEISALTQYKGALWEKIENMHSDGIFNAVTIPDGEFTPEVYDEYGTTADLQFITLED